MQPCDMRKSFDGLHALVVTRLGDDPRGGAVFVCINRTHNLIKLLHWDGTGLCKLWFLSSFLPVALFHIDDVVGPHIEGNAFGAIES